MSEPRHKPRIALPSPTSHDAAYNGRCWPEYAAAIEGAGGEPVRIALGLDPADTARLVSGCDAILLPGSPADVHPQKYGQEPQQETAAPDLQREATDELLLQDAFHLHKPLLGICYGLQAINVWRGGTLEQHLSQGHDLPAGVKTLTHPLVLDPESHLLWSLYLGGPAPVVNSKHHQAVATAGDGLRIAARAAEDGIIEALEGGNTDQHFVLGVQWHPERCTATDPPSRLLFTAFIAAAHRWRLPQG